MKTKSKIICVIAFILLALLPISAFAHSGRTDANGGHWDRKTGTYHYHNGGHSSGGSNNNHYSYRKQTTQKHIYSSKIEVSNPPRKIEIGKSESIEAKVYPLDAEDNEISWKSSDSSIAKINEYATINAIKPGTVTITGKTSKGTTYSFKLVIYEIVAKSIEIEQNNFSMHIDSTDKINAKFTPENPTNSDIKWESSDKYIVSIDDDGTIYANNIGKATITATHKNLKDSIEIEVLPIKAKSVSIKTDTNFELDKKEYTPLIEVGDTVKFRANIFPDNTTDKTIKWSVSDKEKAEITDNGLLTANKLGKVTVIAETENGIKDEFELKIHSNFIDNLPKYILICTVGITIIIVYIISKKKKEKKEKADR